MNLLVSYNKCVNVKPYFRSNFVRYNTNMMVLLNWFQFTCAAPSHVPHMLDRGNHCGTGDVWVCNSDGYVGQVCILSMVGQIQVR